MLRNRQKACVSDEPGASTAKGYSLQLVGQVVFLKLGVADLLADCILLLLCLLS